MCAHDIFSRMSAGHLLTSQHWIWISCCTLSCTRTSFLSVEHAMLKGTHVYIQSDTAKGMLENTSETCNQSINKKIKTRFTMHIIFVVDILLDIYIYYTTTPVYNAMLKPLPIYIPQSHILNNHPPTPTYIQCACLTPKYILQCVCAAAAALTYQITRILRFYYMRSDQPCLCAFNSLSICIGEYSTRYIPSYIQKYIFVE